MKLAIGAWVATAASAAVLCAPAAAAPGDLEPGFGTGGRSSPQLPLRAPLQEGSTGLDRQPGGGLVAAAGYQSGTGAGIAVARYTASGALDPSFGDGGVASVPVPGGSGLSWTCGAARVLALADGKVLAAVSLPANWDLELCAVALTRLLADGTPDPSFGRQGLVHGPAFTFLTGLGLQSGGRVIVAASGADLGVGTTTERVVAYDAAGRRDLAFKYTPRGDELGGLVAISDLAVLGDDRLVVLYGDGRIARLLANGRRDASFGAKGVAGVPPAATALATQPDGRIVVAAPGNPARVWRLFDDGAPNTGFGAGGVAEVPGAVLWLLSVQPDGGILLGGRQAGDDRTFAAARLGADGCRDEQFGGDGLASATFREATALTRLLPDGDRIVTAGVGFDRYSTDLAVFEGGAAPACPRPDGDGDGLPDADDRCPDEASDRPGGCPLTRPTPTPTPTPTETAIPSPTETATPSPTATAAPAPSPQPSPAPTSTPGPLPPPAARLGTRDVDVAGRIRARTLLRRGVRVRVHVPVGARSIVASLRVPGRPGTAARRTSARQGAVTVRLRPSPVARRALARRLRRARTVRVKVRVVLTPVAGATSVAARTVEVRR